MLLHELTGVKSQKGKTAADLLTMLKRDHGITIDHGAYGIVLMHPSWDHVLKLFAKDDSYLQFIDYCFKNQSAHLPVFKKKPQKLSVFFKNSFGTNITHWAGGEYEKIEKFYAVKIEKLKPISAKTWEICEYISSWKFLDAFGEVIGTKKADEFLEDPPGISSWKIKSADLRPHKELIELIFEITESVPSGASVDFNEGNFMMRGDTIVITDPYAAQSNDEGMEITKIFKTVELNDLAGGKDLSQSVDLLAKQFSLS